MTKAITVVALLALVSLASPAKAQTATITWTDVRQTIDGFGGALGTGGGRGLTPAQADILFSTNAGAGLSMLRMEVWPDGTYPDNNAALLAVARGAKVWAAPWSPPASMKTSKSLVGGSLAPESYAAYATYLADWVRHQDAADIPIFALSVQNEPDIAVGGGGQPTCLMSASEFHDFILNNLGPTFSASGLEAVKIVIPETSKWIPIATYADATMDDSASAAYVSVVAGHGYDGTGGPYPNGQKKGKALWETEVSTFYPFDPSMQDALFWARSIHSFMTLAYANSWNWWAVIGPDSTDNEVLIHGKKVAKRLWAMGNFSKFVRPGYVRIGATATPRDKVFLSAYKDSASGNFAIVVINENRSAADLSFAFNGFTATSVTPWVTSAKLNLAPQPMIQADAGTFSVKLAGSSVTTFVGAAESGSTPPATAARTTSPNE